VVEDHRNAIENHPARRRAYQSSSPTFHPRTPSGCESLFKSTPVVFDHRLLSGSPSG